MTDTKLSSAEARERVEDLQDEREDLQAKLAGLEEDLARAEFAGSDTAALKRSASKAEARLGEVERALRGSEAVIAAAEAEEAAENRREVIASYNQVIGELPALAKKLLDGINAASEAALRMRGIEDLGRALYGELVTEGLTPPIKSGHTLPVRSVGRLSPEIATLANNLLGASVRGDSAARNHGLRAAAALERMVSDAQPIPTDWAPQLPGDSE